MLTLTQLGYAAGIFFLAPLGDRFDRRRIILVKAAALVVALLAAGANPNLALESGETPLMVAARGGYAEVAEQLLVKGANPNAQPVVQ